MLPVCVVSPRSTLGQWAGDEMRYLAVLPDSQEESELVLSLMAGADVPNAIAHDLPEHTLRAKRFPQHVCGVVQPSRQD